MTKILLDVFGGDTPEQIIDGIARTLNEISDVIIVAVGDEGIINDRLSGIEFDRTRLEIINADEVITNNDNPVMAIRQKKNSSLVVSYNTLKNRDDIPIMITAGNTGAVVIGSVLMVGRGDRLDKPALVSLLPNEKGGRTCLCDCGANLDCKPEHLVRFARYASEYMKKTYKIESPKVALLSVGTEDTKGNEQTKATFTLLRESDLNFVGNMEARTALKGDVDVIVTDGFGGNLLLKSIEGTAKTLMKMTMGAIMKNAPEGTDLSFVKRAFGELMTNLDFKIGRAHV